MFPRISDRLSYANVTATLALIFAMSGGALAASRYLITSTKQISPKVLKQLKGHNGKNGTSGVNGVNGANGPQGVAGPAGQKGSDGVSVVSGAEPSGTNCANGGSKFIAANGTTYACNGAEGPQGLPGPQEIHTLPPGSSEKGTWVMTETAAGGGQTESYAISFPIPLAKEIENGNATFIGANQPTPEPECTGSVEEPGAEAGHLCVFARALSNTEVLATGGGFDNVQNGIFGAAGTTGTVVLFKSKSAGQVYAYGTWAVTAPTK